MMSSASPGTRFCIMPVKVHGVLASSVASNSFVSKDDAGRSCSGAHLSSLPAHTIQTMCVGTALPSTERFVSIASTLAGPQNLPLMLGLDFFPFPFLQ